MTAWQRHTLRFAIGGSVTVAVSLIAQRHGPVWAGLFLALPVLFPATRARAAASAALGATLGSIALFVFALVACCLLTLGGGASSLLAATMAWFVGAGTAWLVWKRRHRRTRR